VFLIAPIPRSAAIAVGEISLLPIDGFDNISVNSERDEGIDLKVFRVDVYSSSGMKGEKGLEVYMRGCIYMYMSTNMYTYVCICIYVYIYVYIHT
jgi:hypothetical protein